MANDRGSSFSEMEARATVALDSGDGGTRRACNNENCSRDYLHKGLCSDQAYNLIQQAKKTIAAVGHRQTCGFSGCTCGAVNTFKVEQGEFWRQVRAFEDAIKTEEGGDGE